MRSARKNDLREAVGDLDQAELRAKPDGDRQGAIRGDEPAQDLPVQIGHKEQRRRQKGQQRSRPTAMVRLRRSARRAHWRGRSAWQSPVPRVSSAAKKIRPMKPIMPPISSSETISAQERRMETSADRASRSSGPSNGTKASVIAKQRNSRTVTGTRGLENPGISIRHAPIRQNRMKAERTAFEPIAVHEIVPSDLISTPRAISRCERTGKVANRRSMTMRT